MSVIIVKSYYRDPGYVTRVLIALDELGGAILKLPNDLTISSWCGLWRQKRSWKRQIGHFGYWALDKIQYHHCEGAIIHDEERAEYILNYLQGASDETTC
jgi:hypothetical protein